MRKYTEQNNSDGSAATNQGNATVENNEQPKPPDYGWRIVLALLAIAAATILTNPKVTQGITDLIRELNQ